MSLFTSASRNLCNTRARYLCRGLLHLANVDHSSPINANTYVSAQRRFARKVRNAPRAPEDPEVRVRQASRAPDEKQPGDIVLPEVPEEILDMWDEDKEVQAFLSMFASEDLQGKKLLAHRDVAKLLECLGLSHEQLVDMINSQSDDSAEDDPLDISAEMLARAKKGQKGGSLSSRDAGKGFEQYPSWDDFKGGGKGAGKYGSFDSDFDGKGGGKSRGFESDFGGKGGKGGMKGKRGNFDDFDDDFAGKGGGKSRIHELLEGGKGGMKGKRGSFDDFDDDFGFGKGGRGGKSYGKRSKGTY